MFSIIIKQLVAQPEPVVSESPLSISTHPPLKNLPRSTDMISLERKSSTICYKTSRSAADSALAFFLTVSASLVQCCLVHNCVIFIQLNCQRPDPGLRRIPDDLAHASVQPLGPNDVRKQSALLPNPLNQPAPSASFSTHFTAANSCLDLGKARINCSRESGGGIIRAACDNLSKSCVACWSSCLEYRDVAKMASILPASLWLLLPLRLSAKGSCQL